ncbi:hypothetical protein TNCV_2396851 [Trichonephila clavipes]|uniref:Uncharacterized protein n=1 Tax=Trichonephila clavipes TaxID=2585209 RepID=A0A8X6VH60_TRICX|nr:hypothetical protein TNCV_2396851 [Trichonephila clavipes]
MQEAAKRKAEQETTQQPRPPPTPAELNPKTVLPSISANKPPQQPHTRQDPDKDQSANLASTLEDFQDPRVIEMLDVLKKFVQISKTNKTRAAKFWELTALLKIKV